MSCDQTTFRLMAKALVVGLLVFMVGCSSAPPKHPDNICAIFDEKGGLWDNWYKSAKKAKKEYGVSIPVMMATMHQESRFVAKAKPPRTKLLGFIPWKRASSAYGYAQVKKDTWRYYQKKSGNNGTDRDKFKDAVQFVGWYHDNTSKTNKVKKSDTYNLYLAYHEGNGGFTRKTYNKKPWLLKVARKVDSQSKQYQTQLSKCQKRLDRPWWLPF